MPSSPTASHRTSISLEDEFWLALRSIAAEKRMPINALVADIDVKRGVGTGLASAIRLFVLRDLQARLDRSQSDAR